MTAVAPSHRTPEAALEAGLTDGLGRPVRIASITRKMLGGGEADYPISRWRVTLTSGEELRLIFKRCTPDPEDETKGAIPGDFMREVLTYRHLLADPRLDAPKVYASVYDTTLGQYWLFIEDLGASTLEGAGLEEYLAAARYLGRMHGAYAGREDDLSRYGGLVQHTPEFYRALAAVARRNLLQHSDAAHLERFDRVMQRFDEAIAELLGHPRTLLHGDFSSHNVALQPDGRIRPIDWEWAAIGPAGWDLVRLYHDWQSNRTDFLSAYLAEFQSASRMPMDAAGLERRFTLCQIVYRVWFLYAVPDRFAEPGFVDGLLRDMERAWSRLA